MNKREKKFGKATVAANRGAVPGSALAGRQSHPPKKQPVLLAVSVVLFALGLVFLLVTAVLGQ